MSWRCLRDASPQQTRKRNHQEETIETATLSSSILNSSRSFLWVNTSRNCLIVLIYCTRTLRLNASVACYLPVDSWSCRSTRNFINNLNKGIIQYDCRYGTATARIWWWRPARSWSPNTAFGSWSKCHAFLPSVCSKVQGKLTVYRELRA